MLGRDRVTLAVCFVAVCAWLPVLLVVPDLLEIPGVVLYALTRVPADEAFPLAAPRVMEMLAAPIRSLAQPRLALAWLASTSILAGSTGVVAVLGPRAHVRRAWVAAAAVAAFAPLAIATGGWAAAAEVGAQSEPCRYKEGHDPTIRPCNDRYFRRATAILFLGGANSLVWNLLLVMPLAVAYSARAGRDEDAERD